MLQRSTSFGESCRVCTHKTSSPPPPTPLRTMGDKVTELGGNIFACHEDTGICCNVCCCGVCQLSEAMEKLGKNSCIVNCLLLTCVPCYSPICTGQYIDDWNVAMGGESNKVMRIACQCFCGACSTCQLLRAIKKAESTGAMKKIGAPAETEMSR